MPINKIYGMTIKAVDLKDAGIDIERIAIGKQTHIFSAPHGVDTWLLCSKIVEPLDVMEDLGAESRLVIYPSIQAVLLGDDIRALLKLYSGSTEDSEETVDSREAEEEVAEDNDEDTADSSENDGKENSIGESEDDGREAL